MTTRISRASLLGCCLIMVAAVSMQRSNVHAESKPGRQKDDD